MDSYQIAYCPNCEENITSTNSFDREQQVICNLNNEGGMQEGIDILPILTEESYLKAYPEERKCRAFLEFCKEGDVEAIVDVLKDDDEEDEGEADGEDGVTDNENGSAEAAHKQSADILRYQDPTGSMVSGLHLAVMNGMVEVIWLLLLLASNLDYSQFPAEVKRAAEQLGITREDQTGKIDIRTLKDSNGRTAEDIANGTAWGSSFDISLLKDMRYNRQFRCLSSLALSSSVCKHHFESLHIFKRKSVLWSMGTRRMLAFRGR